MKTYIASPFFNDTQLNQVKSIENLLNNLKDEYYSPRMHGNFSELKLDTKMSNLAKSLIFEDNISQIKSSDRVIVNLNGHRDIGTLFEFGVAISLGKLIQILIDDEDKELEFDEKCLLTESTKSNFYKLSVPSNLSIIKSCKYIANYYLSFKNNTNAVIDTNLPNSFPVGIILLGFFYSCNAKVSYISSYISKSNLMISESGIKQYKTWDDYSSGNYVDYSKMEIN